MPTYIALSNLIIPKSVIQEKYPDGIEAFRERFFSDPECLNQEDNQLFAFLSMNPEDFDTHIDHLLANGLSFDNDNQTSYDFVVLNRYGGMLWKVSWLLENTIFVWHKDAHPNEVARVRKLCSLTMDDWNRMQEKGENPYGVIREK